MANELELFSANSRVPELIRSWILNLQACSPNTRRTYVSALKNWAAFVGIKRDILAVTRDDVVQWLDVLRQRGCKDGTLNSYLSGIKSLYDWLITSGDVKMADPCAKVKIARPIGIRAKPLALSREEAEYLLSLPSRHNRQGRKHFLIMVLQLVEGLRIQEVANLHWRDFKQDADGSHTLDICCKGRSRTIAVRNDVAQLLYEWMRENPNTTRIFQGKRNNRPIHPRVFRRWIDAYLQRAGLKKPLLSTHALRRTHATLLLDAGVNPYEVARHDGHNPSTLLAFYDARKTATNGCMLEKGVNLPCQISQ